MGVWAFVLKFPIRSLNAVQFNRLPNPHNLFTFYFFDILAAVKRTAIPHHATFLEWSRQWG
ncbi:MAG: hypothetical protein IM319_11050 [Microcystis sp. M113S1]|nr:hypothetical protein [Microcystis sp. M113S1]